MTGRLHCADPRAVRAPGESRAGRTRTAIRPAFRRPPDHRVRRRVRFRPNAFRAGARPRRPAGRTPRSGAIDRFPRPARRPALAAGGRPSPRRRRGEVTASRASGSGRRDRRVLRRQRGVRSAGLGRPPATPGASGSVGGPYRTHKAPRARRPREGRIRGAPWRPPFPGPRPPRPPAVAGPPGEAALPVARIACPLAGRAVPLVRCDA